MDNGSEQRKLSSHCDAPAITAPTTLNRRCSSRRQRATASDLGSWNRQDPREGRQTRHDSNAGFGPRPGESAFFGRSSSHNGHWPSSPKKPRTKRGGVNAETPRAGSFRTSCLLMRMPSRLERHQRRFGDPHRQADAATVLPFDAEDFSFAFPHHPAAGSFEFYRKPD